jgi:hypothetical protein
MSWWRVAFVLAITSTVTMALGGMMNLTVVIANGGVMPVVDAGCYDLPGLVLGPGHVCADPRAHHLLGLADWIHLGAWVVSPGDVLLDFLGRVLALVAGAMILVGLPFRAGRWPWLPRRS